MSLRSTLRSLSVENVFVYVGDAVRWDHVPESLQERGAYMRTVASSIHSPPSFASLVTGLYPPRHGVFSFEDRIPGDVPDLFGLADRNARFVNSVLDTHHKVDPIHSVLDLDDGVVADHPFDGLQEPFVAMERGPGGHAPYSNIADTAWEYFEKRGSADTETIRHEYRASIRDDVSRFEDRLAELDRRGLLENTLVVYTSDHGELLGEGGLLGHNATMRPELVYVPTVLIHPEIDTSRIDRLFRHVDLLPTVGGLLDEPFDGNFDGDSLLAGSDPGVGLSFYDHQFRGPDLPGIRFQLACDGAWTADGGHVINRSRLRDRLAILAGKSVRSSKRGYLRRHPVAATRSFLTGNRTYGTPSIDRSRAAELIDVVRAEAIDRERAELTSDAEQRLHDLGYL